MKKAVIILADGFEEIEAVTPIDILRRCEVKVTVAGLTTPIVKGSRDISIQTDCLIGEIPDDFDMLILPGGARGAKNLASSTILVDLIISQNNKKKYIAAICAAPALVLNPTGILSNKKATGHPDHEKDFNPDVTYLTDNVVIDGKIITSRGAGTAFDFALTLGEILAGKEVAEKVCKATQYSHFCKE